MNPQLFADEVKLHKKKGKFTLRGRAVHPLREIHATLTFYHRLHKSQVQQRHHLLDLLVRRCDNHIRGKDPSKTGSEKVLAGLAAAFAANKSKKGLRHRENPFTTSHPGSYQIWRRRAASIAHSRLTSDPPL